MKNQIDQIASINIRCDNCNRKNDLISQCYVINSQNSNQICCHSCINNQKKYQQSKIEQVADVLQECQQIKAFLISNKVVDLVLNPIYFDALNVSDPVKVVLQNSKEFLKSSNLNEADFKNYCKKRVHYKQLLEDQLLKQRIINASDDLKSIIKQYFYDEDAQPLFITSIPKSKYQIVYSQVLSHYLLILKYLNESEQLSNQKNKKIKIDDYNPSIIVQIFDLKQQTSIYEDILIQSKYVVYITEEVIKSYLLEQTNIIYLIIDYEYYSIDLNSKQSPNKIDDICFQVIGENLIFLGQNALIKFDPVDYEVIQKKDMFERNWSNNEFLISYDKQINSFIIHHQTSREQNQIFEIIHLNTFQCSKRIIFANNHNYKSFYYSDLFNYLQKSKTILLIRQYQNGNKFLISLNLQSNKIIRKFPIFSKTPAQNINILKNEAIICIQYPQNNLELYQISTGKRITSFENFEIYQIMQKEQLAICIKQDDIKIFQLAQ